MKNMVICGLGYISSRVAKGCLYAHSMNLYGLCSRSLDKAERAADEFGVPMAYGAFTDVLEDRNVDVVYLCTPNNTHVEMTRMALCAGKSVICEKPLASSAAEVKELFSLARDRGVFLMEAEKTVFTPLMTKIRGLISAGAIGTLTSIEAAYAYNRLADNPNPAHWIFGKAGGCALDIGVYPACFANALVSSRIADVRSVRDSLKGFSVDFGVRSYVTYDNGVEASITASWCYDLPDKGGAIVHGTRGFIEIPAYWKATEATIQTAEGSTVVRAGMVSDFTPEIMHAAVCIERGFTESPLMGESQTLAILRALGVDA